MMRSQAFSSCAHAHLGMQMQYFSGCPRACSESGFGMDPAELSLQQWQLCVCVCVTGGGSSAPAVPRLMFAGLNRFTLTNGSHLCPPLFSKLIIVSSVGGFPWVPKASQTAPLHHWGQLSNQPRQQRCSTVPLHYQHRASFLLHFN